MSEIGKLAMEQAERRVDAERDAGVARARASLPRGLAAAFCSCGEAITEARRQALPGTLCCIDCARQRETGKR